MNYEQTFKFNPNMGNFQIRLNSNPRQYQCVQVVDSKGMVIYSIDHPISQILVVTTGNMVGVFLLNVWRILMPRL